MERLQKSSNKDEHKAKLFNGFGFVSFCFITFVFGISLTAHAQSNFAKRQQERKSSRWTLQDWFETKKRMSDQNSWLSVNHANSIAIDGAISGVQTPERAGGTIDLYMKWLGVRLGHFVPVAYVPGAGSPEIGGARSQAHLQLRLFGSSIQDTNVVIRGGVDYDDVQGVSGFDNYYLSWNLEPEVQIYFAKFLGVWGSWKYRFAAKPADARHLELSGASWSTAAFLEANALRLEVGFQSRVWNFLNTNSAATHRQETDSLFAGLRLFY